MPSVPFVWAVLRALVGLLLAMPFVVALAGGASPSTTPAPEDTLVVLDSRFHPDGKGNCVGSSRVTTEPLPPGTSIVIEITVEGCDEWISSVQRSSRGSNP